MTPAQTTRERHGSLAVGTGLALVLVMFPLLILGSAAALLVALWPSFLGAYLQFGYVPGTSTREAVSVGPAWWLATAAWLALLVVVPVTVRRRRSNSDAPGVAAYRGARVRIGGAVRSIPGRARPRV